LFFKIFNEKWSKKGVFGGGKKLKKKDESGTLPNDLHATAQLHFLKVISGGK